jgi:hypothetical protein
MTGSAETAKLGGSASEETLMARNRDDNEAQLDELGEDPGQVGPDSGGQSGDTQGLSEIADGADESVEELADTGQAYEAEVVQGLENAADHPEQPVHTHEDQSRPPRIGPDSRSE